MLIEPLENRRLMSASLILLGPSLENGILRINGGANNESFSVKIEGDQIVATMTWSGNPPMPLIHSQSYDMNDVRRIVIQSGDGNDHIAIDSKLRVEARISAGGGDDTVQGGGGSDIIRGGAGDDVLIGRYGDDIILAGGGNDSINGRNGNDHINGGSGDDRIRDLAGQNAIHGGSGNDIAKLDTGAMPLGSGVEQWLRSGGGDANPFQPYDPQEYGAILYWDDDRLMLEFNRTVNGDRYEFSRLQVSNGVYEVVVTHEMQDYGLGVEHFMHRWDVTAAAGSKLVFTLNQPLSSVPTLQTTLLLPDETT